MKTYLPQATILLSLFVMFPVEYLTGQDTIYLKNPSFEDLPRKGTARTPPIFLWKDCGWSQFPMQSPPDIHPVLNNAWGVTMQPEEGNTYLGLVVRADHSWESVGQKLDIPLRAGSCYSFKAMLALSEIYQSSTFASNQIKPNQLESFVHPIMLVIWGGEKECDKLEILAESSDVENYQWQPYEFLLTPDYDYSYISIEAYYSKSSLQHYNGHIMIDNLSPIIEIECK